MSLEKLSWKLARDYFKRSKVALIPVGSTEQHGPHLPLGTDFLIVQALAEDAASEAEVICTPVIPVGISEHHRQFWGTLWVEPEAFRAYMKGLAQSLANHGANRIIFVNGHGGNIASLQEVCRSLRRDRIYALVWSWWTDAKVAQLCSKLFKSRGTHAGAIETSMIMAINESLVDKSALEEASRGAAEVFGITRFGAQVSLDTIDFSESGATQDPREASIAAGKTIYKAAKEKLVALISWLGKAEEKELVEKPHKP